MKHFHPAGRIALLFPLLLVVAPAVAQSPEEQLAAASALFDARRYADAAQRLEQFLAANPKHPRFGPAALALGRCFSELKQFTKAVPAYEKAVGSKDPDTVPVAQLGLGEAAMHTRQWEKAVAALDAAVKGSLTSEQGAVAWFWLGQANFHLGKYPAAEAAYLRVTRDFSRSDLVGDAYFGAGLAALRQGKGDLARGRMRTVVDRYPKAEDRPRAMVVLAQLDLDAGRPREARAGFESLLNEAAVKADADLLSAVEEGLIQALLELQEFRGAAARLEALLGRLPAEDAKRARAQLSLGHCRYRQQQYEPALTAYQEAAKGADPGVAGEGGYWAANAALALKRSSEAANLFRQMLARHPKHELAPKAQLRLGDALLGAKQADAAAAAYRAVIERYPEAPEGAEANKALAELVESIDDPAQLVAALKNAPPEQRARGTLRLARLHLQGKRPAEAVAPLTALLKTKPEPGVAAEAHYLLGLVYEAQERPGPSAAALAEAVRGPTAAWTADAQVRLAWLSLELKQAASAEKAATAALALRPEAELANQARLALIQACLDQQKWDGALAGCRELLAANPTGETVATVLFTQAWVSEQRGKPEEALPIWERLAAEHPRSQYAADAYMRVGDARLKAEKFDEAHQQYMALLRAFPKSPLAAEARFRLGSSLYNRNRHGEAAAEFDRVAEDTGAGEYGPEALYWAGLALEKAGKKSEAIQRLSRLVQNHPKHARVANAKIRLAALKAVAGG